MLTGLVNAAIQNVEADVPVTLQNVQAPISVVCVTDSLNGNHLEILKNIDVDVIDDITSRLERARHRRERRSGFRGPDDLCRSPARRATVAYRSMS